MAVVSKIEGKCRSCILRSVGWQIEWVIIYSRISETEGAFWFGCDKARWNWTTSIRWSSRMLADTRKSASSVSRLISKRNYPNKKLRGCYRTRSTSESPECWSAWHACRIWNRRKPGKCGLTNGRSTCESFGHKYHVYQPACPRAWHQRIVVDEISKKTWRCLPRPIGWQMERHICEPRVSKTEGGF